MDGKPQTFDYSSGGNYVMAYTYNESNGENNPLEEKRDGEVDITGPDAQDDIGAQEDIVMRSAYGVHKVFGKLVLNVEYSLALRIKVHGMAGIVLWKKDQSFLSRTVFVEISQKQCQ